MPPKTLRCGGCGNGPKGLYLHDGKLFCALCLTADENDDMTVKVKIALVHTQAVREQTKRVRGR